MLGRLLTRILIVFLGYAYPAFECYKTVEKNRVEIQELRLWCQYWIIVAMLTVLERVGDVFISWSPMYDEGKVALFIYLWCSKTKETFFVYKTFLRPYVTKYETDIDRKVLEMRARAWDLTAEMKVVAAYLLVVLGGKTTPTAEDLKDIPGSGNFPFALL
ncbi:hypothetical protein TB2_013617 [Malus domestica]